eukprot:2768132-Pyramimonas_sp.AAC.1
MIRDEQGHVAVVKRLLYLTNKDASDRPKLHHRTTVKGETALMAASKMGHAECVDMLAAAGADPNHVIENIHCHSKLTALHMAAAKGHDATVAALLDVGASVAAMAADGSTAVQRAVTGG